MIDLLCGCVDDLGSEPAPDQRPDDGGRDEAVLGGSDASCSLWRHATELAWRRQAARRFLQRSADVGALLDGPPGHQPDRSQSQRDEARLPGVSLPIRWRDSSPPCEAAARPPGRRMSDVIDVEAPYPGLRPFESHEAEVFFGREAHTDRLLEILQREHLLAVIGPSGSGKSSLVRAGLLPSLSMGALGSGSDWRVAIMRPGDQPIRNLAAALLKPNVFGRELTGDERVATASGEHVALVPAELRPGPLGWPMPPSRGGTARTSGRRRSFRRRTIRKRARAWRRVGGVRQSALAPRADPTHIHVVLTMRTDFLGNCVRFVDLPDAINRAQYLTPRLTRAEMQRATAGPAEVFGGRIDTSLVAEIINETGGNSDQLPIVQHALSRMWARAADRDPLAPSIGWTDVNAVGGMSGALDQHAESVLRGLVDASPDCEALVEALFCAITERRTASSGGQDVRRPQALAKIATACRVEWETLSPIVKAYAAKGVSLLQHGPTLDEHSVIDLSHEALMRQWSRLSRWVDIEARHAAEYRRWTERAADHRDGRGGLLEGAALTRALEWRAGETTAARKYGWLPTPEWAARYATSLGADAELKGTRDFIDRRSAPPQKRQEIRTRAQRVAALERAGRPKPDQAARRAMHARIVAFFMLAMTVATIFFAGKLAKRQVERIAVDETMKARKRAEDSRRSYRRSPRRRVRS